MTGSSSTFFDKAFAHVIGVEGGYSNDKNDLGGATRYGITEAEARSNGYTGPMTALPLDFAKGIYQRKYWGALSLDDVAALSYPVALELFDTGVNMGIGVSGKFFQRSLNALNRQQRDYPDVTVDGAIGPRTVAAMRGFFKARGAAKAESVLLKALNCLQGARYIELTEARPANEDFTFGWLDNRVGSV